MEKFLALVPRFKKALAALVAGIVLALWTMSVPAEAASVMTSVATSTM